MEPLAKNGIQFPSQSQLGFLNYKFVYLFIYLFKLFILNGCIVQDEDCADAGQSGSSCLRKYLQMNSKE
jgi:hypothetical protein